MCRNNLKKGAKLSLFCGIQNGPGGLRGRHQSSLITGAQCFSNFPIPQNWKVKPQGDVKNAPLTFLGENAHLTCHRSPGSHRWCLPLRLHTLATNCAKNVIVVEMFKNTTEHPKFCSISVNTTSSTRGVVAGRLASKLAPHVALLFTHRLVQESLQSTAQRA